MAAGAQTSANFHADLKAVLPRLRMYALSLTRARDLADDLVQETVVKALAGRHSFRPGTYFAAWVFRILRNEFISGIRRQRPTVPISEEMNRTLAIAPQQDGGIVMHEFLVAFSKLTDCQREALVLGVLEGQSYEQIARHAGVAVGTIKSRVSRARDTLEQLLLGEQDVNTVKPRATNAGGRHVSANGPLRLPA